jgi:hypothetical protein
MTAATELQAPYDRYGNLIGFPGQNPPFVWRANIPFRATLRLLEVKRFVSSARATWRDTETGIRYPMLLPDLSELLVTGSISQGVTTAYWMVEQRGRNFGIRLATEEELQLL